MNNKTMQEFLQFELDEKLFERTYKGTYYWQALRFSVFGIIDKFVKIETESHSVKKKNQLKSKFRLLYGELYNSISNCIGDINNWRKLKVADILYFDQETYRKVQGKMVDSCFDYFEFDKQYSIQRCFYCNKNKTVNYVNKGIGTSWAELIIRLILRVKAFFPNKFSNGENAFIYQLCKKLNSRFDADIRPELLLDMVNYARVCQNIYRKYYLKLLRKIKPKVIFVVCHYDKRLWALYPAAKELGIPVIEIEHGHIVNHIAYYYMDISDAGKMLPDYLFSYGEYLEKYIKLPRCMKTYSIGNAFLEDRKSHYINCIADEKKIVIYSQAWDINGKTLESFAVQISNKYYSQGYRVYFKIHPSEYKDWNMKYTALRDNSQIAVITDEMELYKLISMAKHQIGVFSTVLYETMPFNVNTYILAIDDKYLERVQPLIENKLVYVIQNVDDFEKKLLSGVSLQKKNAEFIWKENAKQNAQNALDEILIKWKSKRKV